MKNVYETARKTAASALELTGRLIDEFGPRLTGTEACRKSAVALHGELEKGCDRAVVEEFDVRPGSFLGFLRLTAVVFGLGSLLMALNYTIPAAIVYSAALFVTLTQFLMYLRLMDPFYRKVTGYNVYGVIEPEGDVRRQVIISGHHDSVREFRFLKSTPRIYRAIALLAIVSIALAPVLSWLWVFYGGVPGLEEDSALYVRAGMSALFIFVFPLFFFVTKRGVPGAGDNLIASAIAVRLANVFGAAGKPGKKPLRHTRVILASFDAEEAGLRGARAFARRHRLELKEVPAFVFNMDSIYRADKIKFLLSDINGLMPLSVSMARECVRIATGMGHRARTFRMLLGAGATDAAEFARIGVEATTLIALPTQVETDRIYYHTRDDRVENIEPAAVEAAAGIAMAYVLEKDREAEAAR